MNNDQSSLYGLIGFFLGIGGLFTYAYLMKDNILPKDFMILANKLPLEISIFGIAVAVVMFFLLTMFMKSE